MFKVMLASVPIRLIFLSIKVLQGSVNDEVLKEGTSHSVK